MNKAFVKENENADDDAPIPVEDHTFRHHKNYMTPEGAEHLRRELNQLLQVERPKICETIAWAASNGDRSENADYIYGKRRLREIDSRVRFLSKRLDKAEVVDPEKQKGTKVLFGATVTVRNEAGKEITYYIVGVDETSSRLSKISWMSPIGKALLGASVGDVVTARAPAGDQEFEILSILYQKVPENVG